MSGSRALPKPPKGLESAGKALWRAIVSDLPSNFEFSARELRQLELAARQADAVAGLEAAIDREGIVTRGSRGQQRLNPLVAEARQGRLAVSRLIGELALPDTGSDLQKSSSKRSSRAAHARWGKEVA